MNAEQKPAALRRLPAGVWVLGFGSLFMDISSEMIHSLLPVFMGTVLGVSMFTIGVIEGVAEATAAVAKVFSGAISDYLGKRKPLVILGYGLAALTKPVFPLANSVTWVFGARFVDRIGKGIRGAPRDALIADITPAPQRGAAYGLRQALDSVGALIGPLAAMLLMLWLASDIRAVMWVAVLPAFIAVGLLIFGLREPGHDPAPAAMRKVVYREHVRKLRLDYWLVVALGGVFTLARFSEAFLVLRADDLGLSLALVPLVMIVMNLFYSAFAYPAGAAADRVGRRMLLMLGSRSVGRGGSGAGLRKITGMGTGGQRAMGIAYGLYPGSVRKAGRRYRAGRSTRHRVRHLQPDQRWRAVAGQRARRLAVESVRPGGDVCRRRGFRRYRAAWPAVPHDAARPPGRRWQ